MATNTDLRSPDTRPSETPVPPDPARYTTQQEREMGVMDDKGRKIQPQGAFLMIGWSYVFAAGVGAVIVAIILRFTGAFGGGQ